MVARYRAWRFVFPQVLFSQGVTEQAAGLQVKDGRIEMVEEDDSVRQAIYMLVSTRPGERIMRPDYGCSLDRLVFAPNDETTAGLAIHYVQSALDRWEPRIEVISLDAQAPRRDPKKDDDPSYIDPTYLEMTLVYRVRASSRVQQLTFPVNLAGPV